MAAADAKLSQGAATSAPAEDHFLELERVVRGLVERYEALRVEHAAAKEALRERDERIRHLDEQLLESNQLRQDTAKRIDDLIAQIDRLDATLEQRADAAE